LPKHFYALDFKINHYTDLLTKLNVFDNEERFNDKKGAIYKAIIQYFARSHQRIDLQITCQTFTLIKHFIDPSRPESFDRMLHRNASVVIDILNRKNEFSPLPFLISIPEIFRTKIIQGFIESNESLETARKITRHQINTIFDLDERDIIFFIRGRISIRRYTPPKKFQEGAEKRFGGESFESMDTMHEKYFPDGTWEYIEEILGEALEEKLNFSIIDNITFMKTFIPVFRSMIEILLLDIINEKDREKIEGLTGYILRQNFHKILLYTAKNLLEFVEIRDKNAEFFIKYFTDDVIIDANGNKIQKFAIIDSRQQRWNYSSIVSIIMQYKQSKLRIATQQEAIISAQERVNECQNEINIEKNNQRDIIDHIDEVQTTITDIDTKVLLAKGQSAQTPEEAVSIKSDIKRLNIRHAELLNKKKSLNSQLELVKNRILNKNSELTRRQRKLDYEQKSLQSLVEQTVSLIETYEIIAEAISLVLAKR
jgi:hypothetical protein